MNIHYTLRATRKYFVNGAYDTSERTEYLYQDLDSGDYLTTLDLSCGGNHITHQKALEFLALTRYHVKHNGFIKDWFYTKYQAEEYILENKAPIESWPGSANWSIIRDEPEARAIQWIE